MERYSTLEICLTAKRVCEKETILRAQDIWGLWKIYPLSCLARSQLLIEGLNLRGQALSQYDKNPRAGWKGKAVDLGHSSVL